MTAEWYARYCRALLRRIPANAARFRIRLEAVQARAAAAETEVRAARRALEEARDLPGFAPREMRRMRGRSSKAFRRWQGRQRRAEQPALRAALADLGLDLRSDEIVRVATVTALLTAIAVLPLVPLAALMSSPALVAAAAVGFVLCSAVFLFFVSYPEVAARRLRIHMLGKAPEAVNYLAMALRLNPSLDRAIAFAAESAEEPLAARLRRVLWAVVLRSPAGVEDAFLTLAQAWTAGHEELRQALFTLRASSLERSEEARESALDKARDVAFAGTHRRMRDYADSLRGPTTALFAVGVLLPMMIGAMLPLLSLGGLGGAAMGSSRPAAPDPWPIVLALDVAFPAALFAFAWHVLGRRPGTMGAPDVRPRKETRARHGLVACGIAFGAVSASLLPLGVFVALVPPCALGTALASYLLLHYREAKRTRDALKQLERELPDALFLLGNRVAEGHPVEAAMRSVAASMEGSSIAALLRRIAGTVLLSRGSLAEALFGTDGLLRSHPSRAIRSAMRLVVDASAKDPIGAGRAIIDFSNHLRELLHIDREVRRELGAVVAAMRSTSTFFGPLVLGVTAGMYTLLARVFSGIVPFALPPAGFLAAVASYLVLGAVAIGYFATGIEHGPDPIEFRYSLGKSLPLSLGTFAAAAVAASALLNM